MNRRRDLAAALLGTLLAACSQLPPPAAATTGAVPRVPVESRLSARFIFFVGRRLQHDPPFLDVPYSNFYCLRSFLDREIGEVAHQLYVADSYFGGERGWDAARDATGHTFRFAHIGTHKIGCDGACAYEEEFAATIAEAKLRRSAGGLTVIFNARSGKTMTIAVSGDAIASQLAAVDAERSRLPPHAAATPAPARP